jgi:crotonobetainyl-CoA:carnitine CoA-transferase CaiB-like acyl-CoA transferase
MGALDGLRVLDVSRLLPGPFCTTLLADHGADVIVVEAPRFRADPVLGHVPMVRRNKRHMSLDLKSEAGKEAFFKLASRSDVLVEGFRPGVMDRLGVGYDAVRAVNDRIVYCALTGYGQTGPLANRAGHDMNYMATAGMLDLVRDKDGTPIMPNFQMADLSGSLYAALGILLALAARERSGKGQYVDVAMTDGLVSLLPVPLTFAAAGLGTPGRPEADSREWFACYRMYETRDHEHLSVGPLEPHLWTSLCNKLGCPQYGPAQYDKGLQGEITQHLEALFRSRDLKEWVEFLNAADDCTAPVNRVRELHREAQLATREMVIFGQNGLPEPGIAPKLSSTPGSVRRSPYEFGQHTREVLAEHGYSPERIEEMHRSLAAWSPEQ